MGLVASIRSFSFARCAAVLVTVMAFATVTSAATVTYTVDPASGRVTKATYPDGSYITYSYDINGNRTSAVITNAADTSPPTAPGAPTFSNITATSVTANWTVASDNTAVTAYEWSRNGGSTWSTVGSALSASITGLTGSTSYTILVHAKDAANNIGPSSSASFTTSAAADTSPPGLPGVPGFSAVTATTATANWGAATDNVGVMGYEYSLNGGSTWTATGSALPGVNLTGLTSGVTYTFQVHAKDAANNAGLASSNTFTTLDNVLPGAPGTPSFSSITGTSATASWGPASDNVGVTGYQWRLNSGSWTAITASPTLLTGLSPATSYTFQVQARDAAGNWGPASSNTFTTLDTSLPSAPGTPSFSSITGTSATASWGPASDNVGVTGYQWRINGGGWTAISASPASLTGLSPATTYVFDVQARDAAGNWGAASSNSFTTLDTTLPSAPGTPSFSSVTGTSATASWGAASDNVGVTGYQWRLNSGSWTAISASPASLTGLTANTTYTFEVQARDAAGNWGPSSSASFTTPVSISIFNRNVNTVGAPFTTTAFYRLTATGDIVTSPATQGGSIDIGDWISPKAGMGNFQARMVTGNCNGPPVWVPLTGDVTWQILAGGNPHASASCSMTVEISAIANPSVILGSAVINLSASF